MKGKFSIALSLTLIVAMLVTSLALADQITVDGDTSTAGAGNSQFELCPGQEDAVTVRVTLKYNGNKHFNDGSVTVTATVVSAGSSFITADSGSLTLSGWGVGDEVFTDLDLAVGSNWAAGSYKVTYTLTQDNNSYTEASDNNVQITEKTSGCASANTPPTVDAGGPYNGTEGSAIALDSTVTDDGTPTLAWSYSVVTADLGASCSFSDAAIEDPTFTCNDDGSYTVTLTADDGVNATVGDSANVTVSNADPVVAAPSWPNAPVACRTPATLTGISFSDAGVIDYPWSVNIDWGDSSTDTDYNTNTQGAQSNQNHTYNTPGTYTATVGVTDKDGGFGSNTSSTDLTVLQTYTINFLQPFDGSSPSNLITNTMKSGRTVPVKVTIYDDCAQAYINDPATMVKIFLSTGTSTGGSNDAVEVYADAGASNGNTLFFRWTSDTSAPGGGFWIYNLDSKTALNGSALVVGMTYRIDVFFESVKATSSKWALLKPVK